MCFRCESLVAGKELEKKILSACNYNGAKAEIINGKIITIEDTNISYIEPNKAVISIKNKMLVLLYYDNDNLFLFDRYNPLKISDLRKLMDSIRLELSNDN